MGHAPTLLAVRGALTREVYGESADLPLGDPGLLARALYKSRSPRSKVILLPHFSAFGTVSGRQSIQAGAAKGMHVLPPTLAVDDVCQAIADARLVITSSLHGLIVGHATRTPTILCTFGHTQEPDFKYFDYMSPYRRSPTLVPFSHLLEHGVRNWEEAAAEEVEAVSDEIDDLIEGLLAAAGPLR
ncbi:polysaccharide pyruvyl transferase family protein [Nocardioides seonyuensis]|uniref:polysaccharide pyruvyl transferase family protein n=1 Tax=Nocardioides seonyuensis TaxID=2518371 RepID=UPI0014239ACB|nr:polysaccharide pyruvyl transferase family protein [Nocardioides seonyuensis]